MSTHSTSTSVLTGKESVKDFKVSPTPSRGNALLPGAFLNHPPNYQAIYNKLLAVEECLTTRPSPSADIYLMGQSDALRFVLGMQPLDQSEILCPVCWSNLCECKTSEQEAILRTNKHLEPAYKLYDGDWLVSDVNPDFGPYILTTDGLIQDVEYHYLKYHTPAEALPCLR